MSDLSFLEKHALEKLLGMGSGYVLNFSDRTFQEFVVDTVQKNIFDDKYRIGSGSKANCLRGFWKTEPNHIVAKLLKALIEYSCDPNNTESNAYSEGMRIIERLQLSAPIQEIDAIIPNTDDHDFEILAKSVRDSIDKDEPQAGLDRLHTFVIRYIRVLCGKQGIDTDKSKPLHSLFGEYIKYFQKNGLIESEMTVRILKSNIAILEAFNKVRNDQSFAHDNKILNYRESILIFNNITNLVKFINSLENCQNAVKDHSQRTVIDDDDLPF
jgi:hypothetical protein